MNATRIGALVTALVIAAVLGLTWVLGASPLLAQAATADDDRAAVEAVNAAQEARLAEMRAQFERLDELEAELAALRVSMPGVVDPEFVYALLAGYSSGTGAKVEAITVGEAQPYGQATAEAADPTTGEAPVGALPGVFTVPVTIMFAEGASSSSVLRYSWALQRGPRLFLVTSVAGGEGTQGEAADAQDGALYTISAYMFVVYDPDADPDEAANTLVDLGYEAPELVPWTPGGVVAEPEEETPAPEATETPAPEGEATPSPTPTP